MKAVAITQMHSQYRLLLLLYAQQHFVTASYRTSVSQPLSRILVHVTLIRGDALVVQLRWLPTIGEGNESRID